MASIATRLKQLREEKGYSQVKVQMETAIDQSSYSKLERGEREPTIRQAAELARVFDTSIDYIVCNTDNRKKYPKANEECHLKKLDILMVSPSVIFLIHNSYYVAIEFLISYTGYLYGHGFEKKEMIT